MSRPRALRLALIGAMLAGVASLPAATASTAACPTAYLRLVHVSTAAGLQRALAHARPGDEIRLADGVYYGGFTAAHRGYSTTPVVICGSSAAILDGRSMRTGYTLHIAGAPYTVVEGITVRHGQKGVVVDSSPHVTLTRITVDSNGYEAIQIRRNSTDVVVRDSRIFNTGRVAAGYGEAVYVGTAKNNWCDISMCQPDRSDRAHILDNVIGPGVTAEAVDVKEGTASGTIVGNTFDGRGMTAAYSWVDVKGNSWTVQDNNGRVSRRDGFTDTVAVAGWGNGNRFTLNHAVVDALGYGFRVAKLAAGVKVYTDNTVIDAAAGAANVQEQKP